MQLKLLVLETSRLKKQNNIFLMKIMILFVILFLHEIFSFFTYLFFQILLTVIKKKGTYVAIKMNFRVIFIFLADCSISRNVSPSQKQTKI